MPLSVKRLVRKKGQMVYSRLGKRGGKMKQNKWFVFQSYVLTPKKRER